MNTRLQRMRKEILTIGLALVMIAAVSIFPSQHTPAVQAQGGEATFVFSDLQFDGSRYYYPCSVFAGYINVEWRMYLADNVNYIVNEIALVNVNVNTSVFFVEPGTCIGFHNCASLCNACVLSLRNNCKLVALGQAAVAGVAFLASFACAIGAAATIVGVGIAFLCGAAAGTILAGTGAAIYGAYQTCKAEAPGICTSLNPPCTCTG